MISKIPIAATPISIIELFFSLKSFFKDNEREFIEKLSTFLDTKYLFLMNSGLASFFVVLEALKHISGKKEVVLPAYTAHSLIVAIKKAQLIPVLCDISLDDFNMDFSLLPGLVCRDTLAILGVHMFGIVARYLEDLKQRFPDIFIIEDCAQAQGSKIKEVPVGNLGDVSFFSFNRGKNLPTYGGGSISTNDKELAEKIDSELKRIRGNNWKDNLVSFLKIFCFSLAVRPFIYGLGYRVISQFKDIAPPCDFEVKRYTNFQAKVCLSLLKRIEEFSKKRYHNGMSLINGLKDVESIVLPKISEDTQPAFNRLPVVFKDLKKRERVEQRLWKAGIETSRMYLKPLHHQFDLGYKRDDFLQATYFAEHLLTLPTHPLLADKDLNKIIETIRKS